MAVLFYRIFDLKIKLKYTTLRIHFISIGGSLMHSLAIALKQRGHEISGSDDEIYDPSRTNLEKHSLLPENEGWDTNNINKDLDAVIVGMHAREDNPELQKAQELDLKIYSAPEFIYLQSENKQRIVIGGSHGKSSIVSMIIHVLNYFEHEFDFALGAHLNGFENMVQLTDAPVIVIEGDEYLSSPVDPTPKFLHYQHHIGLISGISWDHINVFPSENDYVRQFDSFADATPKGGSIIYCEEDSLAVVIGSKERMDVRSIKYNTHPSLIEDGKTFLLNGEERVPIQIFGRHNLQNISGAMSITNRLGITKDDFYEAIQSFKGTDTRLELIDSSDVSSVFVDFAHAPSKVLASTLAVKEQFPDRELIACLELHTFSSLNKTFLKNYKDGLRFANFPLVYFNPKTIKQKQLEPISEADVKQAFGSESMQVFTDKNELEKWLFAQKWEHKNLLLMSSGTFDHLDITKLANHIVNEA